MTSREFFNRRKTLVFGAMYAVIGVFFVGILVTLALGQPIALFVTLPAFVIACLVGMVAQLFAFRCQECRGNMSSTLMYGGEFRIDPRLHFCPYCGLALDEELPASDEDAITMNPTSEREDP